jgi:probable HAF family extracellular repeat protein
MIETIHRARRAQRRAVVLFAMGSVCLTGHAQSLSDLGASERWYVSDGMIVMGVYEGLGVVYRWTASGGRERVGTIEIGPGGPVALRYAQAAGLSSDGSTFFGTRFAEWAPGSYLEAFVWSINSGTVGAGAIPATSGRRSIGTTGSDASADGSVLVGNLQVEVPDPKTGRLGFAARGFRWTRAGGLQDIGAIGGADTELRYATYVEATSADGNAVVGRSRNHAFLWTTTGGMRDLGTLAGPDGDFSILSNSTHISADGRVVLGFSTDKSSRWRTFRWTETTGMVDLGTPNGPDPSFQGGGTHVGMSSNGNAVAGTWGDGRPNSGVRSYRWTEDGGMKDLGRLARVAGANPEEPNVLAAAISANGAVVVGTQTDFVPGGSVQRAYRWSESAGMQTIEQWTGKSLGTGLVAKSAYAVNGDGSLVLGMLSNDHTFVAQGAGAIDVDSTGVALARNAAQAHAVMNLRETRLRSVLAQDCAVFGDNGLCLAAGGSYASASDPGAFEAGANLRVGWRIAPRLRAGLSLDQVVADDAPSNIRLHGGWPLIGAFAVFDARDAQGRGPALRVATAWHRSDVAQTRLSEIGSEAGRGDAGLNSRAALAEVSYALVPAPNWRAEPFAGLRYTRVERKAYTEKAGAAFPASYAAIERSATTALLGVRGSTAIAANTSVTASAGVERDLHERVDRYAGVIDVVGGFALAAPGIRKSRPFASIGVNHDIDARQRVSAELVANRHAIQAGHGVAAMLTYAIGL